MDRVVDIHGTTVLVCAPKGPLLEAERDADDFLSLGWQHGTDMLAIPIERLGPDILRLRTRLLGQMVQKFVNYRMRLAIVGDILPFAAESGALRDFVYEANQGKSLWFVADLDALAARLAT